MRCILIIQHVLESREINLCVTRCKMQVEIRNIIKHTPIPYSVVIVRTQRIMPSSGPACYAQPTQALIVAEIPKRKPKTRNSSET